MARYVLIAMNGAAPGTDPADLEKWYEEVHMPDLLSCEGIKTARRFEVVRGTIPGRGRTWTNCAIYEIDTDDLAAVSREMQAKCRPFDPSFDRSDSGHLFAVQIAGDAFPD